MKHLDTFVQYKPRHTIIFMEVLEVTDTIDTKEICNVSWYMVCARMRLSYNPIFRCVQPMVSL